jgi:hypothetical protein
MAIESLELALQAFQPPVYVYHEIVHNKYVVERFRREGAVFVDHLTDVPEGATLLFSASSFVFADEGMYAPDQIAKLPLAKRGLKIKPNEIYNPGGVGLTDAVIRLSVGCTAEFVRGRAYYIDALME